MRRDVCPFCGEHPYHYVDVGVGHVPVAVDCCELGDLLFRGQRPVPETVTMSWQDFTEVARLLSELRARDDEAAF